MIRQYTMLVSHPPIIVPFHQNNHQYGLSKLLLRAAIRRFENTHISLGNDVKMITGVPLANDGISFEGLCSSVAVIFSNSSSFINVQFGSFISTFRRTCILCCAYVCSRQRFVRMWCDQYSTTLHWLSF